MTPAPPPPVFPKSLMALTMLIFCLPQHCWVWAWETFTQSCYISNWRAIRISATNKWVRSYLCNHQSNILDVSSYKTELSQSFLVLPNPLGLDTSNLYLPAWGLVSRLCYFLLFPVIHTHTHTHTHPMYVVTLQSNSRVQLFVTSGTAAHQASLSFIIIWSLLWLMSIESVMPSNHLIFCSPLLLLPSIFPSTRVFYDDLSLHIRWPNY